MQPEARVQTMSRFLRIVFTIILIGIPLIQILFWIFFNQLPPEMIPRELPVAVKQNLTMMTRLLALAASFITTGVVMACVYQLIRLFRFYEHAEIFTEGTVGCLRTLGRLLIGLFVAGIIQQPLLSVALTLQNPPGQRMLTFGLNSDNITVLLFGGVVVLITWVMDEGRKLQEEQRLTV